MTKPEERLPEHRNQTQKVVVIYMAGESFTPISKKQKEMMKMKNGIVIKGMELIEEDREAAQNSTARVLKIYSEKLRKLKEEESDD